MKEDRMKIEELETRLEKYEDFLLKKIKESEKFISTMSGMLDGEIKETELNSERGQLIAYNSVKEEFYSLFPNYKNKERVK